MNEIPLADDSRFAPLKNDRLLRAAMGQHIDTNPVWMMRQAGRYLPEYRALRKNYTFFESCRLPDVVAEITIQPVERLNIDAAIIFSDILVIPQALGMEVQMINGTGPLLPEPIASPSDIARLNRSGAAERLGYVYDAITTTRTLLDGRVPLIGFSGAPWTLMAYMVEGGGSKSFSTTRSWLYREPVGAEHLLDVLSDVIIEYLKRQVEAGAQYLQVFDSWAGLLGPALFQRFSLPTLARIASELKAEYPNLPLAVFARGAHHSIEALSRTDFDVISIDWTVDPARARSEAGRNKTLQGNMDPAALFGPDSRIEEEIRSILAGFGKQRTIVNLGHGMMPEHDPEKAAVFVDAVHRISSTLN